MQAMVYLIKLFLREFVTGTKAMEVCLFNEKGEQIDGCMTQKPLKEILDKTCDMLIKRCGIDPNNVNVEVQDMPYYIECETCHRRIELFVEYPSDLNPCCQKELDMALDSFEE